MDAPASLGKGVLLHCKDFVLARARDDLVLSGNRKNRERDSREQSTTTTSKLFNANSLKIECRSVNAVYTGGGHHMTNFTYDEPALMAIRECR